MAYFMKKQQEHKKHTPGNRILLIVILLAVGIGILICFAVWNSAKKEPGEEPMPATIETMPTDKPTFSGSEISPDGIIFSINGKPIPMSVFRYYLYDSFSRLESMFMTNELNFNTVMGEGVTQSQYVINNSVDSVKFSMVVENLAEELNLNKSQAEAEVDEYLTTTIVEAFGGDEASFRSQLALMGTTLESFRDIMISQSLGSQAFQHYYGENWTLTVEPSTYYDMFVTVSDILLFTVKEEINELTGEISQTPLSAAEIRQKRELAETILERLNAGEDFFGLLAEYGEDPGVMTENNPEQQYTIQSSDRIYEFSTAAFSTDIGGYSDIIETSHGYYIIHRLSLDTGAVAEIVKTQGFRNSLFNLMLSDLSRDFSFEPTLQFESTPLETWYKEYKENNYQMH